MNAETIIAPISSKGQVTIPLEIRKLLHISQAGDLIGFVPSDEGVLIKHLEVKEEDFTKDEWDKLEKLADKKGRTCETAKAFLGALKKI